MRLDINIYVHCDSHGLCALRSYDPAERLIACQEECHIQRQRQNLFIAADIVISQLDGVMHMIFFRMPQNGLGAFGIACCGFYLYQCVYSMMADHKIHLQTGILVEVI